MTDAIFHFAHSSMKKNAPVLRAGDTVRVHQRIREGNKERVQVFEGLVIAVRNGSGINGNFTVRRIASGVGVEKTFPLHSPNIVKVERVKTSSVRRAKLYYMRERFGRSARMKNEVRKATEWVEPKVKAEAEAPTEEVATVESAESTTD